MAPVTLSIERNGRVAVVTFRRAEQLNAISSAMQAEITETFEALGQDDDVGAIVVTGEGRGFMAGADIKEYAAHSEPAFDDFQSRGRRIHCGTRVRARHTSHRRTLKEKCASVQRFGDPQ